VQVIARFALIYHLIASKRRLCEHLQNNCMPVLESMVALTDRLKEYIELTKTCASRRCAIRSLPPPCLCSTIGTDDF
jgi:hypothetical protein